MTDKDVLTIRGLLQEFDGRRRGESFQVRVEHLSLREGAFVAIQGPNGCGKTTLVSVLALLRRPSNLKELDQFTLRLRRRGGVAEEVEGVDLKAMWRTWWGKHGINNLRRRYIGFAPQRLELLPALTVQESIAVSLWLNNESWSRRRERVKALGERFGLVEKELMGSRVHHVSVGEMQKVTLARAMAHCPPIIFLDEPTASLHWTTAREALAALYELQQESLDQTGVPTTVVMVTHDDALASDFASQVVRMNLAKEQSGSLGYVESIEFQTPRGLRHDETEDSTPS